MREGRSRPAVVFDTSMLVKLAEPGGLRILEEIGRALGPLRPVVTSPVLRELESLSRRRREAELALGFARSAQLYESGLDPDGSVLEAAEALGGYVASLDGGILSRARRSGIPYITLNDDFPLVVGDP